MLIRLAFLVSVGLVWAANPPLREQPCTPEFLRYLSERGDIDPDILAQVNMTETVPTVEIVGTPTAGKHGGKILRLRRTGPSWGSSHKAATDAPQGDPRWFQEVLGEQAASFFGFRRFPRDEEMEVPDTEELNGAIDAINQRLGPDSPHRIAIRFGHPPSKPSITTYNEGWREGILPIAEDGGHRIHDLSYHTGAIFLPQAVIEHGQFVSAEIDLAATAVRKHLFKLAGDKANDPVVREALNYYGVRIKSVGAINVDLGSGTVTRAIMYTARDKEAAAKLGKADFADRNNTFAGTISTLYGRSYARHTKDVAPLDSAAAAITRIPGLLAGKTSLNGPKAVEMERVLKEVLPNTWNLDLFLMTYLGERAKEQPRIKQLPPMSAQDGCLQTIAQLKAIREAAEALQKEKKR